MPQGRDASAHLEERKERLLVYLRGRGLVRGEDSARNVYGQPALRVVVPGHEPQALTDAATRQKRLAEYAYSTPPAGENSCAAWVALVFSRFGIGTVLAHAFELCDGYCSLTDTADLKVGMIVAVAHHPLDASGLRYGHVGIYVGDRLVRDCVDTGTRTVPLELWLSAYGVMEEPRWGWLGSIALDC